MFPLGNITIKKEVKNMTNYNLVLYIGLALIIGGFCLFLYSQHKLRQLDIAEFKNQQLKDSFYRNKLSGGYIKK